MTGLAEFRALHRARQCWGKRWTFVYIVFNAHWECLYVGMTIYTGTRGLRWRAHQRINPEMVQEAAHFRVMGPYFRSVARRIELEQQVSRRPKYNKERRALRLIAEAS